MMYDKEQERTFEEAFFDTQRKAISCAKQFAKEDAEHNFHNTEYWVKHVSVEEEELVAE